MSLKRGLAGKGFSRAVLVVWIVSAVAIFVLLKEIELVVHGQLYYYGLRFSADWADPYRLYTWLIFLFLGLPIALSSVALVGGFIKLTEKVPDKVPERVPDRVPEKKIVVEQPVKPQPVAKVEPRPVGNGNVTGISCPFCRRVFSRALLMLDFRTGKPKMVSVCPYCNRVLEKAEDESCASGNVHATDPDRATI